MQFYISSNVYIEYINYSIKNICFKMISHIFAFVFIRFHQKKSQPKTINCHLYKKNRFTIPTLERNFFPLAYILDNIFLFNFNSSSKTNKSEICWATTHKHTSTRYIYRLREENFTRAQNTQKVVNL